MDTKHIHISDYNYNLPDERIAKFPLAQRDQSKLLVYNQGEVSEDTFCNLPDHLPSGALMVFNNTKVIQARLHFRKETGALIEVFLLEPAEPSDYELMFQSRSHCSWYCLVGNLKKWKEGKLTRTWTIGNEKLTFTAVRGPLHGTSHRIDFEWDNPQISLAEILDSMGELPIPPYLNRETQESDKTTFKPVKSEEIEGHEMHTEYVSVRRQTLEKLLAHDCQAIAVGTTSVRTLESLYFMGCKVLKNPDVMEGDLHVNQWEPYEDEGGEKADIRSAIQALIDWLDRNHLSVLHSSTQIIIAPGYDYKIVKMLVTNFHQPQSTLLLLVSAFVHGDWHKIYDYAIAHDFRFLSYGDSSLLIP